MQQYAAQDKWVADLTKVQERERDKFLERAVAGEQEPEPVGIEAEKSRRRPSQE